MDKEILYRAINDSDYSKYKEGKDIECLLIDSFKNNPEPRIVEYYNLCINGDMKNALDTIVGHIHGGKLKRGTSCWISTTANFDIACTEYAIPQAGNYNYYENRKNIIMMEVDKDKVLSNSNQINHLRNKKGLDDIIIDVRNSKLSEYYNNCIFSESYNSDMPGYNIEKDCSRIINKTITRVTGFSNYATASEEVLIYKKIKSDLVKQIFYPLQQDILYGCNDMSANVDLELLELIVRNLDKKQQILFNVLYPTLVTGNNLTDIIIDNPNKLEGYNIYQKYDNLKELKKQLLQTIVNMVNDKMLTNLKISRLVDDKIGVYDLNNPYNYGGISEKDIILIEQDGMIYKYNHDINKYINNESVIDAIKVKQLYRDMKKIII